MLFLATRVTTTVLQFYNSKMAAVRLVLRGSGLVPQNRRHRVVRSSPLKRMRLVRPKEKLNDLGGVENSRDSLLGLRFDPKNPATSGSVCISVPEHRIALARRVLIF